MNAVRNRRVHGATVFAQLYGRTPDRETQDRLTMLQSAVNNRA